MPRDAKQVSIVIPAYNAMPELTNTLHSLVSQTYALDAMEIVIVDDCSTDTTWHEIQRFVSAYPDLFVAMRFSEPSGSPAKPRNTGLNNACGKYIFCLDADDWLGECAVEKMLGHAETWGSDVLFVKMIGENGRTVPQSMFSFDQPKVDIFQSKIMWSLGPLKLYRRSLIDKHGLRFSENYMPEDLIFVLKALCFADVVSVAADYGYYHCTMRPGGGNAVLSIWGDTESNLRAYGELFAFIEEAIPQDVRNQVLMRRLYRRDVYQMFISIASSQSPLGALFYDRAKVLCVPFYLPEMYEATPVTIRLVLDAALFGDLKLLRAVVSCGDDLSKCCRYSVKKGKLLCTIPSQVGILVCDVSNTSIASLPTKKAAVMCWLLRAFQKSKKVLRRSIRVIKE